MISSNVLLDREAERPRALAVEPLRPAVDDAHDQRVGLAADARRDLVAGDPPQRLDLLADRAAHAGHGELTCGSIFSRGSPAPWIRKPTAERGLAWVCTTLSATGSSASCAGQRLADDAGEESRRRLVGLARPHHDRRQPDADALAEAAPRVVGEHRLAHRLLGAVGGQRRQVKLVGNGVRERRAIAPPSTR